MKDNVDNYIEPEIKMTPLAAFIRGNHRYPGESFEDYRASMRIQKRIIKVMLSHGSQHEVGYDVERTEILWTQKYNKSKVEAGQRRRFHNGQSRHRHTGDKRRGSLG